MKINIESVHFTADQKLIEFVNEKVEKLMTFFDQISGADVILKLDKASDSENKVTEIKLLVKGHDMFSKKHAKSFEEACEEACSALKTQIIKHKEKTQDKHASPE